MTEDVVIFSWDIGRAVRGNNRPWTRTQAAIGDIPVEVKLTGDSLQSVAKDPLLQQRMVDACKKEFDKAVFNIQGMLRETDEKLTARPEDAEFILQAVQVKVTQVAEATTGPATAAATGVWTRLQSERKDYKKYRVKCAVKVGGQVVGVGAGAAGMGVAVAAGGWGAGLALWGYWRACIDLGKTLADLMASDVEMMGDVYKTFNTLKNRYEQTGVGKKGVAARELAATAVRIVTQYDPGNLASLNSKMDLWKNKLFGVRKTTHDLAIKLNRVLVAAEEYENELSAARHIGWFKKKRRLRSLRKFQRNVNEWLTEIPAYHERVESGLRAHEKAGEAIRALQAKSPSWTQPVDAWLEIAANIGFGVAQGLTGGWPWAEADLVARVAGYTALVNDVVTDVSDIKDAVAD